MLSDTKKHKHLMVILDLLLMKIMQMTNIVLLVTEWTVEPNSVLTLLVRYSHAPSGF